jgi:hypothetical protein
MIDSKVPPGSRTPQVHERTTQLLRLDRPRSANALIRFIADRADAASAPAVRRATRQVSPRDELAEKPSEQALRDAAADIANRTSRVNTRILRAVSGSRSNPHRAEGERRSDRVGVGVAERPPRRIGRAERKFRITLIATERLIEKLALMMALVSEPDDDVSIDEVLELAVDSLIGSIAGDAG